MFLGKLTSVLCVTIACTLVHAEDATKVSSASKSTKVGVPKGIDSYAFGLSYLLWNESIVISQGTNSSKGFANYGGYTLGVERFWMKGRWLNGATIAYGLGKASSGGFDAPLTFADGIDRKWWSIQASVHRYYRLNTTFMIGFGLLLRHRSANWEPKESALTVDSGKATQFSPQLLMRWRLTPHFSFIQSFTHINLKTSTMWAWTAQYEL